VQLTRNGGMGAVDSADGRDIVYQKVSGDLFQVPAAGGPESPIGVKALLWLFPALAVTPRGIYYLYSSRPDDSAEIWLYPSAGHGPVRVGRIADKSMWSGISVSPDNRYVLFSAFNNASGDLYLAYNMSM
jgi:hypothetical protein